jgi:hypothetical protein
LESELPYWLEEAYGSKRQIPDLGIAQRTLYLKNLVFWVSTILNISESDKVLDWGGGNGLLVRMMRDMGINAHLYDLYAKNFYAVGFEFKENESYSMITSFETWEHFVEPNLEIKRFFDLEPEFVLISTGLYTSQDHTWGYLTPLSGRHVFFYSREARELIAQTYQYDILTRGYLTLFSKRKLTFWERNLLNFAFSGKGSRLLKFVYNFAPKKPSLLEADRKLATKYITELGKVGEINWP